ncbi:MAG: alpha/beta fold hydrolase [Chlamydiota bacterium]
MTRSIISSKNLFFLFSFFCAIAQIGNSSNFSSTFDQRANLNRLIGNIEDSYEKDALALRLEMDNKCWLVCIHGFLGSPWNMCFLAKNLRKNQWDVDNWRYSSRKLCISEHGAQLAQHLAKLAKKRPQKPIHFVAHSMGALVLLSALNHPSCPEEAKLGRVALIAPLLKGSSWARWLGQFSLVKWFLKDFSGRELIEESDFSRLGSYPDSLEKILVVAGKASVNPFFKEENDGTISIYETFLEQPHERFVVNCGHKTILLSKKVCHLVSNFFLKDSQYGQVYYINKPGYVRLYRAFSIASTLQHE